MTNTPPVLSSSHTSKKNKVKIVILASMALLIFVVILIMVWALLIFNTAKNSKDNTKVIFKVEQNSGLDKIASELVAKGLITDKNSFLIYARFGPSKGNLKPGVYLLSPSMTLARIADTIGQGQMAATKLTFQEGLTIEEMARKWAKAGLGDAQAFLLASRPPNQYHQQFLSFRTNKDSLEGYLFPTTYNVLASTTPQDQINAMLNSFASEVLPKLKPEVANSAKLNEVIIIASIVEKEVNSSKDRKLVAGVFYNRLAKGMRLESDVTINYVTGKSKTTPQDLKIDSLYNTYLIQGLPPGPICNPSLEAILATAEPTASDYLFFLADSSGTTHFAKTLAEHNQNIIRYLN